VRPFLTVSLKIRYPAGGSVGLLALNALFMLTKDYNLFVEFSSFTQPAIRTSVNVGINHFFIHGFTPSSTVAFFTSNMVLLFSF
jgi:hypothetical protein